MLISISFLYYKNIRGPSTVPWGTPDKIFFAQNIALETLYNVAGLRTTNGFTNAKITL